MPTSTESRADKAPRKRHPGILDPKNAWQWLLSLDAKTGAFFNCLGVHFCLDHFLVTHAP